MVFTGRAGLHKGFKQLKFGSKSDPKLAIFDNFQTVYFYDTPVCDGFLLPNYFEKMKDCKDRKIEASGATSNKPAKPRPRSTPVVFDKSPTPP